MVGTVDTLPLPAKFLNAGDTVNGVQVEATYYEGEQFVVDFGFAKVYGEDTPFTGVVFADRPMVFDDDFAAFAREVA